MPIYEYFCSTCMHRFDELVRKPEEAPTQCPSCGSECLEKAVSAHGGYSFDSGPASVQPRSAGSFKRTK